MTDEGARVIDFATREVLAKDRIRQLSAEEKKAIQAKVSSHFASQLVGNEDIDRDFDAHQAGLAMALLEDTQRDVSLHGVRTIILFEKMGNHWSWKWANVTQNPEDLLEAVSPLYRAALQSVEEKKNEAEEEQHDEH